MACESRFTVNFLSSHHDTRNPVQFLFKLIGVSKAKSCQTETSRWHTQFLAYSQSTGGLLSLWESSKKDLGRGRITSVWIYKPAFIISEQFS